MQMTRKTLARSALVGLFLTVEGMALQVANSLLIIHDSPPGTGHLIGVTACYVAAGFTFALGFFLVRERLPGRTPVGKGLRYAALVLAAVWISGFINLCAIDFQGGWSLFSPAKIRNYLMAPIDCLNFMIGGLVLGLITRRDPAAGCAAPAAGLGARAAVGTLILPLSCAGAFFLISLALPPGYDLFGERVKIFYVFLFIPLAISGGGTALFHDALRSSPRRGILAESLKTASFIFVMYWIWNVVFVLFFGFTWQVVVGFLASMAVSLPVTIVTLEAMARKRAGVKTTRRTALAALAALLAAVFLQACATKPIEVKTPDFASLPDGTYRGSYDGGMVKAVVDVLVAGGRIEKVTIVSHRNGMGTPAEVIVDDVVRAQSLEVDTISGATRSSKVILKAIEEALTQ